MPKKRSFFSLRRDLRLQLLALYLLFVVPVVIAGLIFDQFANQRLENEIKAADLALARAIALETNTFIENALQAVQQLAEYEVVLQADSEGMQNLFQRVQSVRTDIDLIYRLNDEGTMLFHYPTGPDSTVGVDFSFREYFQQARNTHTPLVSLGRVSPTTRQPVATTVMPLWRADDRFLGLVATNLKLQSLSNTLTSIVAQHQSDEQFQVIIIDRAGRVIAHPDSAFLLTDISDTFPQVTAVVLSGQAGNSIEPDTTDQEFLLSYVPIPSAGWGVIVSRPTSAAFATPLAFRQGVLIVITIFLGVGLFSWSILSRRVIQPLQHMATYSQFIGLERNDSGTPTHPLNTYSDRPDQIGHLVRSFIHMEHAIQARLNELSTLLETSAAVVSTLDSQTVLDRILKQVEHLLDVKTCAIVALDKTQEVFRIQAGRGLSQQYTEQFRVDPAELPAETLEALRQGQPVQVSDTNQDPNFAALQPLARTEGFRSILAIPLNAPHASPSALLVYEPTLRVFNEQEINLLTSFANHAAMAIENAILFARSDAQLQEQTRRLEALIHSLEDGLLLEDLQGKVLYANRRINELTGLPDHEILGASVQQLLERILSQAIDPEKTRTAIEVSLNSTTPRAVIIVLATPTGRRYLRLKVFTVTDSAGVLIGRGQIFQDVTQSRELDRMKSSLIATVSHELRTPLAAIKGYATTLLAEDVDWDIQAQHEFLNIISLEVDRLNNLVNDLLDMSRIEAGNLTISRVACDLNGLARRAGQRVHPQPGDRLEIDIPPEFPPIFADPQRIEVVLRNLIENAIKYSTDSSPIRISAEPQQNQVVVRVRDQGVGIPAGHSRRIFDSFYRVEDGLTRRSTGAGLGLAICQGFIHAHGGKIWLEPQDSGTCIAFSLPFEKI